MSVEEWRLSMLDVWYVVEMPSRTTVLLTCGCRIHSDQPQ